MKHIASSQALARLNALPRQLELTLDHMEVMMNKRSITFFISSVLFIIGLLLSGCQLGKAPLVAAEAASDDPQKIVNVADWLRFPGRLWDCKEINGPGSVNHGPQTTVNMADCIRFPGQLWDCREINGPGLVSPGPQTTVNMAR